MAYGHKASSCHPLSFFMCVYEELVSKTSYIHPRHVTYLHYWLPFAIKIVPSLIKYVPIVGYFHLTYCTIFTKWLKVGMRDMQEWTEEVLEAKTLFLCFSLCMFKIYDRVRKQFLQMYNLFIYFFWYLF